MSREISKGDDGLPQFGEDFAWNIFDFSPTIDTKVRKIRAVRKTFIYNRDQIKRRGFNIENPAYYSLAQVIDAGFNIPLDRAMRMVMTLMQISDRDTAMWQRFALAFGWSSWSVGLPYWGTPTTVGNEAQEDANRKKVYDEIKKEFKKDRAKVVVLPMTDFGLIQITRERIRENLVQSSMEICPYCQGTGILQKKSSTIHDIEDWIKRHKKEGKIRFLKLKVHPSLYHKLKDGGIKSLIVKWQLKYFLRIKLELDENVNPRDFIFLSSSGEDLTDLYE